VSEDDDDDVGEVVVVVSDVIADEAKSAWLCVETAKCYQYKYLLRQP
jgi:hypothetical protein